MYFNRLIAHIFKGVLLFTQTMPAMQSESSTLPPVSPTIVTLPNSFTENNISTEAPEEAVIQWETAPESATPLLDIANNDSRHTKQE